MTERTQEEKVSIEEKAIALMEVGEVEKPVLDYIEILQDTISIYQGELYAKNSDIGSMRTRLSNALSMIERVKVVVDQHRNGIDGRNLADRISATLE